MIYSVKLDIEATNVALKQYAATLAEAQKIQEGMTENLKEASDLSEREAIARKKSKEVVEAEAGSIRALREANKQLTAERNNTTLATEEGRKKVEALNKQLDENNAKIKENVDAYTKQKIGIGDYSAALDKLIPGLGSTMNGLKGVGAELWKLVANPIGATLAAIALGFGALMKYFQGSEEGQNRLNQIMTVGSVILEKFWDLVENVGEALYNVATKPREAFMDLVNFIKDNLINRFTSFAVILDGIVNMDLEKLGNGILQLGTGVENVIGKVRDIAKETIATVNLAVEQGNRLAQLQAKIDEDQRKALVERARTELEVSKLREKAISQEGDEKRKTIEEAIALERQLSEAEVRRAQTKLEQKKLELQANGDDKAALLAVAEAEADVIKAQTERYNATLRFQKELEKLADEEKKKKEEEKKAQDAEFTAAQLQAENEFAQQQAAEAAAADKAYKDQQEMAKKNAEFKKKVDTETTTAMNANLNSLLGTQKVNYKAGFDLFKKGALTELLADTNKAATAAMASASQVPLIGWLLGPVAYAATYAKGIASYAAVSALVPGFATGGRNVLSGTRIMSQHGIPIRRSNGDDRLITAKVNETIVNEEQKARLGGDAAFRKAGIPGYAGGGALSPMSLGQEVETRTAALNSNNRDVLDMVDNAIRNMRPVLVMQDFEYEQATRDNVIARAQVIS